MTIPDNTLCVYTLQGMRTDGSIGLEILEIIKSNAFEQESVTHHKPNASISNVFTIFAAYDSLLDFEKHSADHSVPARRGYE